MDSYSTSQLMSLLQQPTPYKVRSSLTMGRCSLLAAAVTPGFDLAALEFGNVFYNYLQVRYKDEMLFDCKHQFKARLALITAYHTEADLKPAMRSLVSATEFAWNFQSTPETLKLKKAIERGPSFLAPFDARRGGKEGLGKYTKALEDLAGETQIGWAHPGLQLAGEMLATLVGDHRRPECEASMLVMFAVDHPIFPKGALARLTVQRLPGGCGLLLPDAFHTGCMWMRPSFSTGLQNALHAARGCASQLNWNPDGIGFDWRWRLDLLSATANWSSKPAQVPVSGRSAEVAFACTMIATARGNPDAVGQSSLLDPHVGATASLETDSSEWRDGVFEKIPLKTVDAIKEKTLLGRADAERLSTIVIAKHQPEDSLPIDPRYKFLNQETLGDAYSAMVRFPRISLAVNERIAARAGAELRKNCDPYIPSAIESFVGRNESHSDGARLDRNNPANWKPLSRIEKSQLTTARLWPQQSEPLNDIAIDSELQNGTEVGANDHAGLLTGSNRIWVCSESGLGKSMFILRCQMKIARLARFGGAAVPMRVGRTSANDNALSDTESWEKLGAEELVGFLTEFLDAAYPPQNKNTLSKKDRIEWIEWLLTNGNVIFLLDALDQSDRDMKDLSIFLTRKVPNCPAIVTGRLEAESNQEKAFRGTVAWQTLRLAKFDRRRQTRYLGIKLADQLLPRRAELDFRADDVEKRRHQWKDLLEAPLLLKLMKDLAVGSGTVSLKNLHSRYDLYDHAVQYMIAQAPSKIEDSAQRKLIEGDERELLEEIAWFMVGEHDFTNLLSGNRLAELKKQFKKRDVDLLDAVVRINLATLSQVVEKSSSGIMAFRHRSFMEFFAGCYLARRTSAKERQQKLEEIHRILDEDGDWLPYTETTPDRPAAWLDTLRFALSAALPEPRHELATKLIELGNPWCLHHSIDRDRTTYSTETDSIVRWLVHREWSPFFNFTELDLQGNKQSLSAEPCRQALQIGGISTDNMLARSTRDASWLSPLHDLAVDLHRFYVSVGKESSLREQLTCLKTDFPAVTWDFLGSFVSVRGGTFDISRYEDQDQSRRKFKSKTIYIHNFHLADFPVTNALFELFCPSFRRWRNDFSHEHDRPAIFVSWYMATEFCHWLSTITGQTYRLPTEWEWEWACRWLCGTESQHGHDAYWWGPEMDDRRCWYSRSSMDRGTRSRSQALGIFCDRQLAHPSWEAPDRCGLLDLSGNVWEWCANHFSANGSSRSLRGGSWPDFANRCLSAFRLEHAPIRRLHFTGFRLCRE